MAARAMWKAVVRIGEFPVPVKLYSAIEDRTVRFRLLHEPDLVPVKRRLVNPETGDEVAWEETRRGFPLDSGGFVMLDEEELAEVRPEPSRDITVTRFVEPSALDHRWYDRPYYLGPDGDAGPWEALTAVLEKRKLEGVARWTMRKKAYTGALRLHAGVPILVTLRPASEVVEVSELEAPGGSAPGAVEIEMAERLVETLAGDWNPEEWEDEYRTRVLELIEAKAKGKTVRLERYRPSEPDEELTEALRRSLEAAGEGKAVA